MSAPNSQTLHFIFQNFIRIWIHSIAERSLFRLKGKSFGNYLMDLDLIDGPSGFDMLENFFVRKFGRFAKS